MNKLSNCHSSGPLRTKHQCKQQHLICFECTFYSGSAASELRLQERSLKWCCGVAGRFSRKNVTLSFPLPLLLPRDAPLIEKERPQQRRLSQRGRFLSGRLSRLAPFHSSLSPSLLHNLVSSHLLSPSSQERSFVSKS